MKHTLRSIKYEIATQNRKFSSHGVGAYIKLIIFVLILLWRKKEV